jgi:hypothetical protein
LPDTSSASSRSVRLSMLTEAEVSLRQITSDSGVARCW